MSVVHVHIIMLLNNSQLVVWSKLQQNNQKTPCYTVYMTHVHGPWGCLLAWTMKDRGKCPYNKKEVILSSLQSGLIVQRIIIFQGMTVGSEGDEYWYPWSFHATEPSWASVLANYRIAILLFPIHFWYIMLTAGGIICKGFIFPLVCFLHQLLSFG